MKVFYYERVCYEQICYQRGLFRMVCYEWSVINRSVVKGKQTTYVCTISPDHNIFNAFEVDG